MPMEWQLARYPLDLALEWHREEHQMPMEWHLGG